LNNLPVRSGKGFSTANGSIVHVQDDDESLPDILMAVAMTAKSKMIVRGIGGVAGLSLEQRAKIVPYFLSGFGKDTKGFSGVISSGGTAEYRHENGVDYLDVSIVQTAAAIGDKFGAVVIHTTPQTGLLQQHRRNGRLVVGGDINGSWNGFDYRGDVQLIVRPNGNGLAKAWDLDCPHYRKFMASLVKQGWVGGGFIANGGLISLYEAIELLALGMPVILVEGSGRECDALIKAVRGDYSDVAIETKKKLEAKGKPLDDYVNAVNRTKEVIGGIECSDKLIHIASLADAATFAVGADKFGWLS
jgi:hypothetical protein